MKILIAAGIYPPDPGGPALHAQAQYVGFRKLGHETKLVALAHYRRWPRWIRHLLYSLVLFFKSLGTDVIYSYDAWGVGFIAWVGARLTGQKFVLRVGGDLAWEKAVGEGATDLSMNEWYEGGFNKEHLFYKLSKFVVRRADAVVVVAPILKNIYSKYYSVPEKKIHIIANPLLEKKEPTEAVGQKIIYASRLVAYKNLDFVIRVMARVLPSFPGAVFIIMGDGPERTKLENLAKELKMSGQIIFKGTVPQSEVIEITRDSLFALAPALTEFNPNYVLQALSYGKPFLVSRENGLPFEVPEEFLFSPRDQGELEAKLEKLLSPEGYQKACQMARNIGLAVSWDEVLKKNLEVIAKL